MLYLNNNFSFDSKFNLALEESLFRNKKINEDIFVLWQNNNSVIIGRNQNTLNEIDYNFVKENNIQITRRISGGGTVFHDSGNLNFSLITNNINSSKRFKILQHIIDLLKKFHYNAYLSGRNDILIDKFKISGISQAISNKKSLLHGTILINSDLNKLNKVLTPNKPINIKNGVKSINSRVNNINNLGKYHFTIENFKSLLINEIKNTESIHNYKINLQNNDIDYLLKNKYLTDKWNFNKFKHGKINSSINFNKGNVFISYDIINGILANVIIEGDFFSELNIEYLQNILNGLELTNLENQLKKIKLNQYINGITQKEFLQLFRGNK